MLSHKYKDRYTVIDESSGSFVVLQQPRIETTNILLDRGTSQEEVERLLDNPAPASKWHAAHAHAAAATAKAVEEALTRVPESAEVQEIRDQQAVLSAAVDELRSEVEDDRRANEQHALEAERLALETWVQSEADRIIEASVKQLGERSRLVIIRKAWESVWGSPEGQRLQVLRRVA